MGWGERKQGEMSVREQIEAFSRDLNVVIDRYREEFELPYAAAIGVLFRLACELGEEAFDREGRGE